MLTCVPFYFLRHGETDWNRQRIIQGQTNTALNATGLAQAHSIAAPVAKLGFATICCSPLLRARATADIVNQGPGKPIIEISELMECSLGEVEGHASNGEWREPWEQGGPMPGGETFREYTERVILGLNQALTRPAPVLVVGHGGNFWALEHHGLIAPGSRVSNCALFKLEPPQAGARLWNVTPLGIPEGPSLAIGEIALA